MRKRKRRRKLSPARIRKRKKKNKSKRVKKSISKDPIDAWVSQQNKEEQARRAEKRRRKEKKQHEREEAEARAEAERHALEQRLFPKNPALIAAEVAASTRQAFCPMRPEEGMIKMQEDEMAALMLCGQCKGGKQHSGANA
mmetsp:Transcript_125006/g.243341  ORF Transcript_125006/g.243341 Transcript_125006/m.243341 type:complete len:141 (+) Transcript_125006:117-539(+)